MTHWGWYWKVKKKHAPKTLCSQLDHLDSFQLFKNVDSIGYNYKITVRFNEISCNIPVEKQPCNYGGYRYFFHCPQCDKRMRLLYFKRQLIGCRKCLRLGYSTQRLTPSKRYTAKNYKIENLLERKGGSLRYRPKRMHVATFDALNEQHCFNEIKWQEAARTELIGYYPHKKAELLRFI